MQVKFMSVEMMLLGNSTMSIRTTLLISEYLVATTCQLLLVWQPQAMHSRLQKEFMSVRVMVLGDNTISVRTTLLTISCKVDLWYQWKKGW